LIAGEPGNKDIQGPRQRTSDRVGWSDSKPPFSEREVHLLPGG
jgi:hypothetical protein